jgi:uncharacterized protein Yka (UPF0111/DUF47 family)
MREIRQSVRLRLHSWRWGRRMTAVGFQSAREAPLAPDSEFDQHLDRKLKMSDVLAKAIREMRDLGASDDDIAAALHHAVDVLEAREDE